MEEDMAAIKIFTAIKMPRKNFDICEARRCQHSTKKIIIIRTEKDGLNYIDTFSLCEKHFEQFKKEVAGG
jgi:hypothetical protein